MQLSHEFAVACQRVFDSIDKEVVKVHIGHSYLALPHVEAWVDALHCRARDEKLLKGAAVEFVELVKAVHSGNIFVGWSVAVDKLGAISPHDGLDHLADEVVRWRWASCRSTGRHR